MSQKAARGTKRTCHSCHARFYDLNRDPIVCPLCNAQVVADASHAPAADVVAEVKVAKPKPVKAPAKEFELDVGAPPAGEDLPEIESADELAEIESEADDISPAEAEDTFLEEEEGEADVAGFIDGPVEGEEEEA